MRHEALGRTFATVEDAWLLCLRDINESPQKQDGIVHVVRTLLTKHRKKRDAFDNVRGRDVRILFTLYENLRFQ
jgi:hypothetical protein